jgi:hypothetical protein
MRHTLRQADPRRRQRVLVVDEPEPLLRAGRPDRRPERAEDLVDAEQRGVRRQSIEVDNV